MHKQVDAVEGDDIAACALGLERLRHVVDDELRRTDSGEDRHARAHGARRLRSQRRKRSLARPMTPKVNSRANMASTARNRWARMMLTANPLSAASSSATT